MTRASVMNFNAGSSAANGELQDRDGQMADGTDDVHSPHNAVSLIIQ